MMTTTQIASVTIDGTTYYSADWRGVRYTAYLTSKGEWCVHSHRLALSQATIGSYRHYPDIQTMTRHIRALAGLALIAMPVGVMQ